MPLVLIFVAYAALKVPKISVWPIFRRSARGGLHRFLQRFLHSQCLRHRFVLCRGVAVAAAAAVVVVVGDGAAAVVVVDMLTDCC